MRFKERKYSSHNLVERFDLSTERNDPRRRIDFAERYIQNKMEFWVNFRVSRVEGLKNCEFFALFRYAPFLLGDEFRIESVSVDELSLKPDTVLGNHARRHSSNNRAVFVNSVECHHFCKGPVASLIRLYTPDQFYNLRANAWYVAQNGFAGRVIAGREQRKLDSAEILGFQTDRPCGRINQLPSNIIQGRSKVVNGLPGQDTNDIRHLYNVGDYYRLISGLWIILVNEDPARIGVTKETDDEIEVLDVLAGPLGLQNGPMELAHDVRLPPTPDNGSRETDMLCERGVIRIRRNSTVS